MLSTFEHKGVIFTKRVFTYGCNSDMIEYNKKSHKNDMNLNKFHS